MACYLGVNLGGIKIKRFADGEVYVQVEVRCCAPTLSLTLGRLQSEAEATDAPTSSAATDHCGAGLSVPFLLGCRSPSAAATSS